MNDVMYVFLDFDSSDRKKIREVDELLLKMDEILEDHGWRYSGFRNMYVPVSGTDCDETLYKAESAVLELEWLKPYNPRFEIGTMTNFCALEKIVIKDQGIVPEEKMKRYSDYYDKKKKYAHGIVVDENQVLRDGYATYLLAKDGRQAPDVMMVRSGQVFKKAVVGRYLDQTESGYTETEQTDIWSYELEQAVIPGDILRVNTEDGIREIRVGRTLYLAGPHDCERYKAVSEHTGKNWQDGDSK